MKFALSLLTFCVLAATALQGFAADAKLKVLCSTYPIYQFTKNVVQNAKGVQVELLIPPQTGCPHDYSLTPQDMKRLASANAIIVNGLKMEGFLGQPLKAANPKLVVIDSSDGIKDTLEYTGEEIDHEHGKPADDEHSGTNPHLFASPHMASAIVGNIAGGLAKLDPSNAALYKKNATAYQGKLEALDKEFKDLAATLSNKRIVTEHGVFDYLARDMKLEIAGVLREYEEESQAPSAATLIHVAKILKERKVGAIFTEPQYPDDIGKALAREAHIPVKKLDPVVSGPENAPLDYYEKAMRSNMAAIKSALGGVKK